MASKTKSPSPKVKNWTSGFIKKHRRALRELSKK
jgi:hypothetical protein